MKIIIPDKNERFCVVCFKSKNKANFRNESLICKDCKKSLKTVKKPLFRKLTSFEINRYNEERNKSKTPKRRAYNL